MKKNRTLAALAASAFALTLLVGCGKTDAPPAAVPDTPPAVSDSDAPPAAPDTVQDTLAQLAQIPGKADAEVTALLGDGTPSYAEDKTLVGRDYTRALFGEDAAVTVLYGDGESADQVSVLFAKTTFTDAQSELTALYGTPTSTAKSDQTGGQSAVWKTSSTEAALMQAYGTVSLSLIKPAA